MNRVAVVSALALGLACGPRDAREAERRVQASTEIIAEGGATKLQARLAQRSAEAMALQEVPFDASGKAWPQLQGACARYRRQWTFLLSIGPKPDTPVDPTRPLALDIENNGGMWGDYSRNLHRLLFEMGAFVRLVQPDGTEIEPVLVEYQRTFGMGRERSFSIVFPRTRGGRTVAPPFTIRVAEFGQGMGTLSFPVKKAADSLSDGELRRLWTRSSSPSSGIQGR